MKLESKTGMIDILRPIAAFTVVVETGSFRAAAAKLGLSPAVVSHHVSTLEKRFDVPLLYRTTRKLTLTDTGREVAELGRTICDAGSAAYDTLQNRSSEPTGLLRVTAPAVFQYGPFLTDVSEFLKDHPSVRLQLDFSDKTVDLIDEGYDAAIRIGKLEDSALIARRVVGGSQVICAAPSYLDGMELPKAPADLASLELIKAPGQTGNFKLRHKLEVQADVDVKCTVRASVSTGYAAMRMALDGAGLVLLPRYLVRDILGQSLIEVLPDWSAPEFSAYAVWPRNVGARSLAKAFVNHLLRKIAIDPPTERPRIQGQDPFIVE